MKRWLLILVGAAALLALGSYWALWASAGPAEGPHTVIVEEGASLADVADELDTIGFSIQTDIVHPQHKSSKEKVKLLWQKTEATEHKSCRFRQVVCANTHIQSAC